MLVPPDLSLVYILLVFFLAYQVINRLVLRPIVQVLDARDEEARSAAAEHARATEEAERKLAAAEERFRGLRRDAVVAREARRGEGAKIRDERLSAARAEAERIVEEGRQRLAGELPALERDLAQQADLLAGEVEERLLGRRRA